MLWVNPTLIFYQKTLIICTATRVYITETKSIRLSDDNQYWWSKTEQELTWKAKNPNPPHHKKMQYTLFFCTQCRMTAVIWYLSYQRRREVRFMSVCVYMHVHVCVYLCIKDALLIKLMDSLQSPVSSPPLSPLSPCSQLPTIKPINTLQQQILLSNVTRKIHYGAERGETAEGCRGGRGTGRNKGSRISGENERGLCFAPWDITRGRSSGLL